MKNHVANMVAGIKNGQLARKAYIYQKKKKSCEAILNVLWDEGFISGYKISNSHPNILKIFLKYTNGKPTISSLKMVSKPSLKIYYSVKQLWKLDPSQGIVILSTSKGILSVNECKKLKLGGEPFIIIK